MEPGLCSNPACGRRAINITKGRCRACYMYWWRTGLERPEHTILRGTQRDWRCRACQTVVPSGKQYCAKCGTRQAAWAREKARRKALGLPIVPPPARCVDCTRLIIGMHRCTACREYRRRHHIPSAIPIQRPPPAISWCPVCGERPTRLEGSPRCRRCASFYLHNGYERPRDLPEKLPCGVPCSNCQLFPSYRRGRCNACDKYLRANGVERPLDLDQPFQCAHCKRSTPAVAHHARELCVECYWRFRNQVRYGKPVDVQAGRLKRPIKSIRCLLQVGA